MKLGTAFPIAVTAFMFAAAIGPLSIARAAKPAPKTIKTVPGLPPVINPNNLYSETRPEELRSTVAKHPTRVYVPARRSHEVAVIDPAILKVFPLRPSPTASPSGRNQDAIRRGIQGTCAERTSYSPRFAN